MGLIRLETEALKAQRAPLEALNQTKRFLADMNSDRSSFFHLTEKSSWASEISQVQAELAKRVPEIDTFLHLGIGGSSLGAEAIVRALGAPNAPTFHFLDNIDPDYLWHVLEQVSPKKTLLYVVTKSGTTMETLAQFAFLHQWLEKHLGADEAKKRLVFCTDPVKGDLRALAGQWGVPCFEIPPNLGGRFSALSAVGLFPAMVAGIDSAALLKGAADYRAGLLEQISRGELPQIAELAWALVQMWQENKRNITVLMPYSQRLKTVSAWFTQLWAESLGKSGKGITPVPAVGATDQHSILQLLRDGPQDKTVGFIEVAGFQKIIELKWTGPKLPSFETVTGITLNQLMDAEFNATRQVLTNNGKPNFTFVLPRLNANTLGQLLFALETMTALAGYFMAIDPFDQPGVEEGKKLTLERIRACKKSAVV